jgi:hypothetical protein
MKIRLSTGQTPHYDTAKRLVSSSSGSMNLRMTLPGGAGTARTGRYGDPAMSYERQEVFTRRPDGLYVPNELAAQASAAETGTRQISGEVATIPSIQAPIDPPASARSAPSSGGPRVPLTELLSGRHTVTTHTLPGLTRTRRTRHGINVAQEPLLTPAFQVKNGKVLPIVPGAHNNRRGAKRDPRRRR